MYIQQLYTNCLAEAAYYVESEGEAAIIDPMRDTEPYLQLAEERCARIRYIFETHFHADFVSGHLDLSQQTGAPIVYGPQAETNYPVYNASDGETFPLGKVTIQALHTPGHTLESTCFLLLDENKKAHAVFTGDTLFVGDVGRPDLFGGRISKEELASMLFDSLHQKIKPLPDDVLVYPAHGPGSACGKNIGKETYSTMGQQKRTNYALQDLSRDEFIAQVTDGMLPPPAYFFQDARINQQGYQPLEEVLENTLQPLSVPELEAAVKKGAQVLDTCTTGIFEQGFIPGSLNIGLDGQYAVWVGTLLPIDQPLLIVTEPGKQREAMLRLSRVGYEKVVGFLDGGFPAWQAAGRPVDKVKSVSADQVRELIADGTQVIDVRKSSEYEAGHLAEARLFSLSELPQKADELDKETPYLVYCGGGYRSMIAISLLKARGFKHLINVYGGYTAIQQAEAERQAV